MDRKKFNTFVKNHNRADSGDLDILDKLQNEYPYSQVLHALSAKTHIRKKTEKAKQKLGIAAMYSADRSVLKKFISGENEGATLPGKTSETPVSETSPKKKSTLPAKKKPTKPAKTPDRETSEGKKGRKQAVGKKSKGETPRGSRPEDRQRKAAKKTPVPPINKIGKTTDDKHEKDMEALRKEVLANLKKYKSLMTRIHESGVFEETTSEGKKAKGKESEKQPGEKPDGKSGNGGESDATTNEGRSESPDKEGKTDSSKDTDKSEEEDNTVLLEEITDRTGEKKLGDKQKEQNTIIKSFIDKSPTIKKVEPRTDKDIDEETSDLARESVSFKDDLVSENLAVIFAKQGKKGRAIDIYKKLIWKYPQKKSYFAARIESIESE